MAATNERTTERSGSVSSTTTIQSNNSSLKTNTSYNHHNMPQHNLTANTLSSLGERGSSTSTLTASTTMGSNFIGGGGSASEPASLDSLSSTMGAITSGGTERTRDLALCAVLLDEWLKELAAIAQEQSVVMLEKDY